MLVLTRRPNEAILIGDSVRICVVQLTNGSVRLGIEAPTEIPIHREEVREAIELAKQKGENRDAA